jgi:hypothetical protein
MAGLGAGSAACGGPNTTVDTAVEPWPAAPAQLDVTVVAWLGDSHCGSRNYPFSTLAHALDAGQFDRVLVAVGESDLRLWQLCAADGCAFDESVPLECGALRWLTAWQQDTLSPTQVEPVVAWTDAELEARMVWDRDVSATLNGRGLFMAEAQAMLAELELGLGPSDPAWLNSPRQREAMEGLSRWRSYYAEESMGVAGELTVLSRMTSRLTAVLDGMEPARVLVLVSPQSAWYVEAALRARTGLLLSDAARLYPTPLPEPSSPDASPAGDRSSHPGPRTVP